MLHLYKFVVQTTLKPQNCNVSSTRRLWHWLNIIFNRVDEDRRELLGPDRTCAEWLLRNGAAVKWTTSSEYLTDYNALPPENNKTYIQEVDATDSSISHYGFPHFVGCQNIEKVVLHKCSYLENEALPMLQPLKKTLKYLQVSSCHNVDERGLKSLVELNKLQTLVVYDFPYIKKMDDIVKTLVSGLPHCQIKRHL